MIHLQGWGEPFLHPRFFDFLHLAKKDGLLVGTTTNGTLWNEDLVRRLVEEGLDLVAFSLAGVEKKNDAIREGTSFKKVLWCIETLKKHKDLNNTSSPYIHIAYMWLKSALEDLLKLPDYLKDLGVRQIVVHTLTFVPSSELQSEVIYFEEEVLKLARDAMYRARDLGMEMRIYLPCRDYYAERCPEDIACTLFISSSGMGTALNLPSSPIRMHILFSYPSIITELSLIFVTSCCTKISFDSTFFMYVLISNSS
jgi:MoaA/NifB/PqqE/SkfB family radical SAM enzyme